MSLAGSTLQIPDYSSVYFGAPGHLVNGMTLIMGNYANGSVYGNHETLITAGNHASAYANGNDELVVGNQLSNNLGIRGAGFIHAGAGADRITASPSGGAITIDNGAGDGAHDTDYVDPYGIGASGKIVLQNFGVNDTLDLSGIFSDAKASVTLQLTAHDLGITWDSPFAHGFTGAQTTHHHLDVFLSGPGFGALGDMLGHGRIVLVSESGEKG